MENYLISNDKLSYNNKKFTTSMNKILDEYRRAQKGSEIVAKALTEIKDGDLWQEDFETFEDAIAVFNIGRAQAYRVIASYKLKHNEEIDGRLENFSLSQVAECGRLEISLMCDVIDREEITPAMTCASIREVVNAYKSPQLETAEEVTEDDDNDGVYDEDVAHDVIVCFKGDALPLTDKDYNDLLKWLGKRDYI